MVKGRMLPPSKGRPIEVTREVVAAEEAAKTATAAPAASSPRAKGAVLPAQPAPAAPVVATPAAVVPAVITQAQLPAVDAPLAEIVAECEKVILAARIEFEEAERKAVAAWFGRVGPAVRLVHATKAYKELTDQRGRVYKSFAKWAQERCGISRPHAYRMVSEGPVSEALAGLNPGQLSTRQVDVLAPVVRQHGAEAVRQVWTTAQAAGDAGAAQLVLARDALGYAVQAEDFEPEARSVDRAPSSAIVSVQRAARGVDRDTLRRAAREDPDGARRALEAASRFTAELQAVLDELGQAGS